MAATRTSRVGRARTPVSDTLSLVHDRWIERMTRLLAPAMDGGAGFWERCDAVRFLADHVEDRFRLEWLLAQSLGDMLSPADRARLARGQAALEGTRDELVELGRRRGTAARVSLLSRRFLELARRWCATLELATARVATDELSWHSRDLLARLRAAAGLGL